MYSAYNMISRLPEDALTLHAETLALLLSREGERGWSHLSGAFTTKRIRGSDYVYFQYSDPGGAKRQFSIGRRSPEIDEITRQYAIAREESEADEEQIARLAGLLRAAGVATVPHGPARILRALADAGVFSVGGVLMGSYAFLAIGNLLGVRWPGAAWRTQDVDIAAHLQVAVPDMTADVPKALDALQMGFVPVPQLDPEHPSTSFRVRGKPLSVDLITPGTDRDSRPIQIRRLNAAAAPIKYLSLGMSDAQPAVVVEGASATLIVVPNPARFALHKLLVSQTRSVIQQTKAPKDLHQASLILEVLTEDRPEDLESAADAFRASGPAVTSKVARGLRTAVRRYPSTEVAASVVLGALE